MTDWTDRVVDLPGCELAYSRRGDGSRGLVMLHAQLGVRGVVKRLVEEVGDRTVLVPDARGRGQSRCRFIELHTWDQYVDDVAHLLDNNGVNTAVLAGVSLGAGLALACALAIPDRVEAVVVWASPYWGVERGWDPEQRPVQQRSLDFAQAVLASDFDAAFTELVAEEPGIDAESLRTRWIRHDPMSLAAALVGVGWSQPFALADLRSIKVPVLVIPGRDRLHPHQVADAYLGVLAKGVLGTDGRSTIADFVVAVQRG